jgi:hypothetical protein
MVQVSVPSVSCHLRSNLQLIFNLCAYPLVHIDSPVHKRQMRLLQQDMGISVSCDSSSNLQQINNRCASPILQNDGPVSRVWKAGAILVTSLGSTYFEWLEIKCILDLPSRASLLLQIDGPVHKRQTQSLIQVSGPSILFDRDKIYWGIAITVSLVYFNWIDTCIKGRSKSWCRSCVNIIQLVDGCEWAREWKSKSLTGWLESLGLFALFVFFGCCLGVWSSEWTRGYINEWMGEW